MQRLMCIICLIFSAIAVGQNNSGQVNADQLIEALISEERVEAQKERIDQVKLRRATLAKELQGQGEPNGFPQLIRIFGKAETPIAQFAQGSTFFEIGIGGNVTPQWRMTQASATTVELKSTDGQFKIMRVGSNALTNDHSQPFSVPPANADIPVAITDEKDQ